MIKSLINKLRDKVKPMRMIITFIPGANGNVKTTLKMDKRIPIGYALTAVDRIKADIVSGLSHKMQVKGLTKRNSKTRGFIRNQNLGDVI